METTMQTKITESIRDSYTKKTVEENKVTQLLALDRKAKMPAEVFAYTFGSIGALTLGTGMCLAMKVIGAGLSFAMPLGIAVGVVGIAMVSANYFLYRKILKSRKEKYRDKILALSGEILGE